MKIIYDPETDLIAIDLNNNPAFTTDSESVPGLSILYDNKGKVCGIEILDSSEIVSHPRKVDFEVHEMDAREEDSPSQLKLAE